MVGDIKNRCLLRIAASTRPITNHAKNTPLRVGVYGYSLKTLTNAKYYGIRQLHDTTVILLSR